MAEGTRSAVALREAVHKGDEMACKIAQLQSRLLELSGKANRSERNQLNRELWSLTQQQQQQQQQQGGQGGQPPQQPKSLQSTPQQKRLIDHWRILHGEEAELQLMALCVRCGQGNAGLCRFHPDAKAFAFGTGRFEYAYTSAWDTPHDWWFCCGGNPTARCEGCIEEPSHTTDPNWWVGYAAAAPALDNGAEEEDEEDEDLEEEEGDSGEGEDMEAGMAAMEIG